MTKIGTFKRALSDPDHIKLRTIDDDDKSGARIALLLLRAPECGADIRVFEELRERNSFTISHCRLCVGLAVVRPVGVFERLGRPLRLKPVWGLPLVFITWLALVAWAG